MEEVNLCMRMSIVIEVLVTLGAVLVSLIHFLNVLILRPRSLRAKLHRQGIDGPSPHFYFGNIKEMKTLLLQQQSQVKQKKQEEHGFVSISHILRSMKTLTMVIQEALRLYPPAVFLTRTAFQDINIKGIKVPKGMNIQIPIPILQHDIDIWGSDAHEFNPERFSNGVFRACKIPQSYMPFGIGSRVCPGQHLSMIELKVFLSLILSKFHVSLSSSYCHSPAIHLLIEPGHGVVLKMTRV